MLMALLTLAVAGVDDGKPRAGGELSHGGTHAHVRHTAEHTRTGWMILHGADADADADTHTYAWHSTKVVSWCWIVDADAICYIAS